MLDDGELEKLDRRKEIIEHPFGTMKRAGSTMLAYSMKRAIDILGTRRLIGATGAKV
ncbi:MAG: hypothetical protein JRN09_03290 [Nitrososphaerota archaeon]|nr:hypothetical protein [Nitrososphaerota archaeon]